MKELDAGFCLGDRFGSIFVFFAVIGHRLDQRVFEGYLRIPTQKCIDFIQVRHSTIAVLIPFAIEFFTRNRLDGMIEIGRIARAFRIHDPHQFRQFFDGDFIVSIADIKNLIGGTAGIVKSLTRWPEWHRESRRSCVWSGLRRPDSSVYDAAKRP